jgi:uncharacterized protein (TIGR03435 family)
LSFVLFRVPYSSRGSIAHERGRVISRRKIRAQHQSVRLSMRPRNSRVTKSLAQGQRMLAFASPLLALSLSLAQASPAPPQAAPAKPLAFEVVTIKPSRSPTWNMYPTPDGYHATGVSLRHLVQDAYGVYDPKLLTGGPAWIDKDEFDLEAKFDPATIPNAKSITYRQRADMMRTVLADRFQLKIHFEKKIFPAYNLVVAKGGPRLTETPANEITMTIWGPSCLHRNAQLSLRGCTVDALASELGVVTGRTVVNKTGLSGPYTIELRFTPDNTPADSPLAGGPSIFTAVQEQLGLKLEPSTAPLDILVIDSAEKPSEN